MRFLTISLAAAAAVLSGCAAPTWNKPGASQDDFARDRYSCMQESQQRVGTAAVNQFGGASSNTMQTNGMLFNGCMNARGWQLQRQQQQQVAGGSAGPVLNNTFPTTNPLAEADKEFSASNERICADTKYQIVFAKSPCKVDAMTLSQRADSSKITAEQKMAFESLLQERRALQQKALAVYRRTGGPKGNRFADALENNQTRIDKNSLALFTGAITWGEYNNFRVENGRVLNAEMAQVRQSS